MRLDHVAIAAPDHRPLLAALTGELGGLVLSGGTPPGAGFRAMQIRLGRGRAGMTVEVLEPFQPEDNDFLARFVEATGGGVHHITFKTDDVVAERSGVAMTTRSSVAALSQGTRSHGPVARSCCRLPKAAREWTDSRSPIVQRPAWAAFSSLGCSAEGREFDPCEVALGRPTLEGEVGVGGHTMRRDETRQRGAALVEFAVLVPLLVFLIFGIIEFGWIFGQYNDIRHAAREGARFAAVDAASAADIAQRVCDTTEGFGAGLESIDVVLADGGGAKGDMASIVVTAEIGSITNAPIITSFTPDELSSDVIFRLEAAASWTSASLMDTC